MTFRSLWSHFGLPSFFYIIFKNLLLYLTKISRILQKDNDIQVSLPAIRSFIIPDNNILKKQIVIKSITDFYFLARLLLKY